MDFKNKLLIILVVFASYSHKEVVQSSTIDDFCDSHSTSIVCSDCITIYDCSTGTKVDTCTDDAEMCYFNAAAPENDAICSKLLPSPDEPFNTCLCYEQTSGCPIDPYNSDVFDQCSVAGSHPAPIYPSCSNGQIFDVDSCVCTIATCQDCGFIAADSSNCSSSFYYCATGTFTLLQCDTNQCFTNDACGCINEISVDVCTDCGGTYGPNPSDPTGSSYYSCDTSGNVVTEACPTGTTYFSGICTCAVNYVSDYPPSSTSDVSSKSPSVSPTSINPSVPPTSINPSVPPTSINPSVPPTSINPSASPTSINPSVPPTTTANSQTTLTSLPPQRAYTCEICGKADAGGFDCSKYYTCNADGTITGTYYCSGDLCFNRDACACI